MMRCPDCKKKMMLDEKGIWICPYCCLEIEKDDEDYEE